MFYHKLLFRVIHGCYLTTIIPWNHLRSITETCSALVIISSYMFETVLLNQPTTNLPLHRTTEPPIMYHLPTNTPTQSPVGGSVDKRSMGRWVSGKWLVGLKKPCLKGLLTLLVAFKTSAKISFKTPLNFFFYTRMVFR